MSKCLCSRIVFGVYVQEWNSWILRKEKENKEGEGLREEEEGGREGGGRDKGGNTGRDINSKGPLRSHMETY